MKLIIDIDNNDYELINKTGVTPDWHTMFHGKEKDKEMTFAIFDLVKALKNGTPYEERPQGKWIPISERLPEEGKSVLVCIKTQGGMSQYVSERFNGNNWSALGGRTPIAWQPLPEPYKKGGAE